MKKNKKLYISAGTSAFNEEGNIKNMLLSILTQKGMSFRLDEILVISDGSTDTTVNIAKNLSDERIRIIDDKKRLGQPARIGQLLHIAKGDVFVLIDSDMILKNNKVFENISKMFLNDKSLDLICGNTEPVASVTFIEKSINGYRHARANLEKEYAFGNTAYAAHAFLCYSQKLSKKLNIPRRILNPDAYSYFYCKAHNLKTGYSKKITALYRSPQTIQDHLGQSFRHLKGGEQLKSFFGEKLVNEQFYLPKNIILKLAIKQIFANPIGYLYIRLVNTYSIFRVKHSNKVINIRWSPITSSKRLLT